MVCSHFIGGRKRPYPARRVTPDRPRARSPVVVLPRKTILAMAEQAKPMRQITVIATDQGQGETAPVAAATHEKGPSA